jgi:hypothetical protein
MTAAFAELPKFHGRHRNLALAAARRVRAVELKTAGLTFEQVADELGYTSRGTAYNVVAKALRDQTTEAVGSPGDLENARLDALQLSAGCTATVSVGCGDVRAAVAIVQIVRARVHLNGLVPAEDRFGVIRQRPRTVVVSPTA